MSLNKGHFVSLIGPMGAGKTTVGRSLARELSLPFVDTDVEIERSTGVTIPTIFEFESESGFRLREEKMLAQLVGREQNFILATGGGIVERACNRALLQASSTVVYLQASIEQQAKRTRANMQRPLLQCGDSQNVLAALFDKRAQFYEEIADYTFNTDHVKVRETVNHILVRVFHKFPE